MPQRTRYLETAWEEKLQGSCSILKTAALQMTYDNLPGRFQGNVIKLMMQFLTMCKWKDIVQYGKKKKKRKDKNQATA